MRSAILSGVFLLAVLPMQAQLEPVPQNEKVAEELLVLRSFLAERMDQMQRISSVEGHRVLARGMEERIEAWRRLVRLTWPEDDAMSAYTMNQALAAAFACTQPGLSASYQAMAFSALASAEDPNRPLPYAELGRLQELAYSLTRARKGKRIQRLLERTEEAYQAVR